MDKALLIPPSNKKVEKETGNTFYGFIRAVHKEAEAAAPPHPLSDEFIAHVNSKATGWKAGRNFAKDTPMEYFKKLMGAKIDRPWYKQVWEAVLYVVLPEQTPTLAADQDLPKDFDPRTKWPQCESLSEIRDQGACGSCWAVSVAGVLTDRQCIHKNESFHFSAEDLVSCCGYCGEGCDGGRPESAFFYWQDSGVVSGGEYGSHQGCSPYQIAPCEHHPDGRRGTCDADIQAPPCRRKCDASYNSNYTVDLRFGKSVYVQQNEQEVVRELFENGPVQKSFVVFEDFLHYKSGVYKHVTGSYLGPHAVKVIGYGEENGVPYYLCANSWNYSWGDGGFFKIYREHMNVGSFAGLPE